MKKSNLPFIILLCFLLAGTSGCDKIFKNKEADPAETEARNQREKATRVAKNFEEAWNRHDASAVGALYTDNAVMVVSDDPKPVEGKAEIEKVNASYFTAFPDLHAEVVSTLVGDNKFMMEGIMTGTNSGPMATPKGNLPPTNKTIKIPFVMVATLNDSLISEDHTYFNPQDMEKQLYPNGHPGAKPATVAKKKRKR